MMRVAAMVCVVALATGQQVQTQDGTVNINLPVDADVNVVRRQTISVGDLAADITSLQSTLAQMQLNAGQYHGAQTVVSNVLTQTQTFAASQGSLETEVNNLQQTINQLVVDHANEVSALRAEMAALREECDRNATAMMNSTERTSDRVQVQIAAHAACGRNGQGYDSQTGQCTKPAALMLGSVSGEEAPSACNMTGAVTFDAVSKAVRVCDGTRFTTTTPKFETLPSYTHRGFSSSRGENSGYVPDRYVTFTKEYNESYIRVDYYDNFRVHGRGGSYANWNVYICDQNGNSCEPCNDPGPLNLHRYSNTEHNQWVNDHYSGQMSGVCRRRGSRVILAGRYRLRVLINYNRNDIHTGHHGQYGNLQVSEVKRIPG